MKTMLDLLIRLQELRRTVNRVTPNPQLTEGEKATASCFKELVRGCLPRVVLVHYDRLKEQEPELMQCPEVFAMAVLVSAYQSLTPPQRRTLLAHFQSPPPIKLPRPDRRQLRPRTARNGVQHSKVKA